MQVFLFCLGLMETNECSILVKMYWYLYRTSAGEFQFYNNDWLPVCQDLCHLHEEPDRRRMGVRGPV